MSANKLRQNAVDTTTRTVGDLKVGDRVQSSHPCFAGIGAIADLPNSDGAVVQLASGERQYTPMKYLRLSPAQTENLCSSAMESSVEQVKSIAPTAISADVFAVEIVQALSPEEERERHRLELKVERAFIESATALRELRDRRLYRDTHPNDFVGYCRDRFGKTKQAVNYLIAALEVYENLTTTIGCRILPTNERQCRELAKLPNELQPEVWDAAVDENNGKVPTSSVVKSVVERIRKKTLHLASDYCKDGEVFFLQRLTGKEKKYNGSWAIALEVENRFTLKAAVYDRTLELRQEQMKSIDSQQTQAEIREISERIQRLIKCQLDPIDEAQIEILCRRSWFTPRQKEALSTMEKVYGVG